MLKLKKVVEIPENREKQFEIVTKGDKGEEHILGVTTMYDEGYGEWKVKVQEHSSLVSVELRELTRILKKLNMGK